MFNFLVDDITVYADYIHWRELIKKVNQEYHDRYYYGQRCNFWDGLYSALICTICHRVIFNYRRLSHLSEYIRFDVQRHDIKKKYVKGHIHHHVEVA